MLRALTAVSLVAGAKGLQIDQGQRLIDGIIDHAPLQDMAEAISTIDRDRARYGWKYVHHHDRWHWPSHRDAIYTDGQGYRQVMSNRGDTQYLAYFQLGGQTMAGILDTGSFELVVFRKDCATCGGAGKYDPSLSFMHKSGKMISGQSYGSGETWSQDAVDLLGIGPYTVNQSFWEVRKANMPVLAESQFQAIIGLGPPGTPEVDAWEAAKKAAKNVSESLISTGAVPQATLEKARDKAKIAVAMGKRSPVLKNTHEKMFSICIGKDPGSDGIIVWNDTSADLHPEVFHEVPVFGEHSWSVVAKNARLGYVSTPEGAPSANDSPTETEHMFNDSRTRWSEEHMFNESSSINLGCEEGCGLLLDSGTSLLALPSNVVNRLVQVLSADNLSCDNMMELPHLLFELNGKTFSLPPDVYVSGTTFQVPKYMQSFVRVRNLADNSLFHNTSKKGCDILVMESYAKSEAGPLWIFGMPFFRKYYTSFALGKSGFGRSIYLAGASETCTPTSRMVQVHDGPSYMWKRKYDKSLLQLSLSVRLAASSEWVRL